MQALPGLCHERMPTSTLTFYRGGAYHGFYIAGESFIGCPSLDGRLRYAD